jgi:hypothetical protein
VRSDAAIVCRRGRMWVGRTAGWKRKSWRTRSRARTPHVRDAVCTALHFHSTSTQLFDFSLLRDGRDETPPASSRISNLGTGRAIASTGAPVRLMRIRDGLRQISSCAVLLPGPGSAHFQRGHAPLGLRIQWLGSTLYALHRHLV